MESGSTTLASSDRAARWRAGGVDIGHGESGAVLDQELRHVKPHRAHTLDGHVKTGERPPENRGGGGDALEDAQAREVRGVERRILVRVRQMFRMPLHDLEITRLDPHVAAREEPAAQPVHRLGVGHEQGSRLVAIRVAHDHGLGPAVRHLDHGRLVGHGPGQAQGVHHRLVERGIGAHPRAAHARSEGGVVDGDGAPQTGVAIVKKDDLFVPEFGPEFEGPQFAHFLSHPRTSSYQRTEFSAFSTQWFSSGNMTRRLGTFCRWSAVKNCRPWSTGTR